MLNHTSGKKQNKTQANVSPTLCYLVNGGSKSKGQVESRILEDANYAKRILFTFVNLFTFCLLLCSQPSCLAQGMLLSCLRKSFVVEPL